MYTHNTKITPAPEESDGYSSDDTLYDSEDQQHYKYEKVVQARFRPSMPKRTKSAPLPSDDEDSSDDEKPALNQNLRIGRSPYIPVSQHPRSEEAKHAIPKITGPISNFTQCTAIPYRYHHAQKARPIPPPLTHVQPCYAMPYVTYPMYYRIPKHTSNSLFNYTNRSK
ncbi:hypothetical protein VKS41_001064 [Umbelopsis sp. WA50703]